MGVENLQKIIKTYGNPMKAKHYTAAIIDGNNLFFTHLAAIIGGFYKNSNILEFEGFNNNVIDQLVHVLTEVRNVSIRYIEWVKKADNVDSIYIVFDPNNSPSYKINANMIYLGEDMTLDESEYKELLLGDDDEKIMLLKEDEQAKRKKAQSRSKMNQVNANIDKMELPEDMKVILKNIAKQSSYFSVTNGTNYIKLMPLAISIIYSAVHERELTNIHFIQSTVEADLSIKNLALDLLNDGADNILILSSDTDYYILFGDTPQAYCRSIIKNNLDTYNPVQVFRALFGNQYSYDAVIRLAPILGNDYTVHEGIASVTNVEHTRNILNFMNIDGHPSDLKAVSARKIKNIVLNDKNTIILKSTEKRNKCDLEACDSMLFNSNPNYFQKYLLSILIYKNIRVYSDDYVEFTMPEEEIKAVYTSLQNTLKDTFGTLYDWTYDKSIYESGFIESISEIEFDYDNPDTLYNMLKDISIEKDKAISDQIDLKMKVNTEELPDLASDSETIDSPDVNTEELPDLADSD